MNSPTPVLSGPDAPTVVLDHIRWASAKGVSVNYDRLSRTLGCSRLEAKEALFEFFCCFMQALRAVPADATSELVNTIRTRNAAEDADAASFWPVRSI